MTNPLPPVQFHILSFEGPDAYAAAGGISTRISGLAHALARLGLETHLWFVGDPDLPGHESHGSLHLHRWCQWISRHHGGGVYEGEEAKRADYTVSLPPWLLENVLGPHLDRGGEAVILAEEWHTVDAVLGLDGLLHRDRLRDAATIFWNANNVFGFDRIDWPRLARAAQISTVSRYMKHRMWSLGVDPVVIPNGLSEDAFELPRRAGLSGLRRILARRTVLTKVARWDPDKRWLLAIEIVAELKRRGQRPLLIARGGVEAHGSEVMKMARTAGLSVAERSLPQPGEPGLLAALTDVGDADVVSLRSPIDPIARRLLFRGSGVVLANSGHEPFGLVGLETMAVGGITCTGCSGEDYAVAGRNALVMQTGDVREFVGLYSRLRSRPEEQSALRRAGRMTAREFAWPRIIEQILLPRIGLARAFA